MLDKGRLRHSCVERDVRRGELVCLRHLGLGSHVPSGPGASLHSTLSPLPLRTGTTPSVVKRGVETSRPRCEKITSNGGRGTGSWDHYSDGSDPSLYLGLRFCFRSFWGPVKEVWCVWRPPNSRVEVVILTVTVVRPSSKITDRSPL